MFGNFGRDTIRGGDGDDVITGGAGNDILYGGSSGYSSGADTFVFDGNEFADEGEDKIKDLDGDDTILFQNADPDAFWDNLEVVQDGDHVMVNYFGGEIKVFNTLVEEVIDSILVLA